MLRTKLAKRLILSPIALATISLAGCGGEAPKAEKGPVERYVYTSALDCEAGAKLSFDDCSAAIDKAIGIHEKMAPKYRSMASCEDKEGLERCERVDDKVYRPKFSAFVVNGADLNTVKPLYPAASGQLGFRALDKETLLAKNDMIIFSRSATDAYELYSSITSKKRK